MALLSRVTTVALFSLASVIHEVRRVENEGLKCYFFLPDAIELNLPEKLAPQMVQVEQLGKVRRPERKAFDRDKAVSDG